MCSIFVSCEGPILHIYFDEQHLHLYPLFQTPRSPKICSTKCPQPSCQKITEAFCLLQKIPSCGEPTKTVQTKRFQPQLWSCFFPHPRRLTWNLRIHPWRRKIIFQFTMFTFYVNLRGWIQGELWTFPPPSKEKFTKMPGQWKKKPLETQDSEQS